MKFDELINLCESQPEIRVEKEEYEDGRPKSIRYFSSKDSNGNYIYHNPDGPATSAWYENRQLSYAGWFLNGIEHRELNKPSYLQYSSNGSLEWEEYKVNGKLHRTDGPALQKFAPVYDPVVEYYINGVKYTKEEFDNYFKDIKDTDKDMLADLGQTFD